MALVILEVQDPPLMLSGTIFELQYSAFPGAETHLTVDPSNTRDDINRCITTHSRLFDHLQPIDELSLRNTLDWSSPGAFCRRNLEREET